MGVEIERKFLVRGSGWRDQVSSRELLRQGYLANNDRCSVRVRRAGDRAWLSVKAMTPGVSRAEFEYPVPVGDADELLATLCSRPLLRKLRHRLEAGGHCFEVDEFLDANAGLVVAEVELGAEDEPLARPAWLGDEVTHALRYYNFRLVEAPFSSWDQVVRDATLDGRYLESVEKR